MSKLQRERELREQRYKLTRKHIGKLKGLLRDIEWSGGYHLSPSGTIGKFCPSCGISNRYEDDAEHAYDCKLAKAIGARRPKKGKRPKQQPKGSRR